jgi:hypothetical protein
LSAFGGSPDQQEKNKKPLLRSKIGALGLPNTKGISPANPRPCWMPEIIQYQSQNKYYILILLNN